MVVHYVTGKLAEGIVVLKAGCGVDPAEVHWSCNKDLVTCWRCKQRT